MSMHQISFGSVLKEARLARGMDLASVSRQLRIRQDIIVAIENSDFTRMPSRGYARNMIIAYARLVGLNPQDVSRMYLDQEYAHQIEQAHRSVGGTVQMHRDSRERVRSGATSSFNRVNASRTSGSSMSPEFDGTSNGLGRRVYSQQMDTPPVQTSSARQSRSSSQSAHRARRSAMSEGQYTNLYTSPSNMPNPNRVVAVLVVVLIVAIFLSHQSTPTTNIPVTGVSTTTSADTSTEETTETETAPTEFTLKYVVDEGYESYIEVYIDDVTQESSTVTGPAEQTYTSSTNIRFVSTQIDGVHVYIDDEEVTLALNDNGIINTTYTFEEILAAWNAEHASTTSTSTSSSSSSSTTSTSSTSSTSSTESE